MVLLKNNQTLVQLNIEFKVQTVCQEAFLKDLLESFAKKSNGGPKQKLLQKLKSLPFACLHNLFLMMTSTTVATLSVTTFTFPIFGFCLTVVCVLNFL